MAKLPGEVQSLVDILASVGQDTTGALAGGGHYVGNLVGGEPISASEALSRGREMTGEDWYTPGPEGEAVNEQLLQAVTGMLGAGGQSIPGSDHLLTEGMEALENMPADFIAGLEMIAAPLDITPGALFAALPLAVVKQVKNLPAEEVARVIKLYHGSPHRWEGGKPDMARIGSGEGAQSYGHGLYYAENPDVAKGYAHDTRTSVSPAIHNTQINGQPMSEFVQSLPEELQELADGLFVQYAENVARSHSDDPLVTWDSDYGSSVREHLDLDAEDFGEIYGTDGNPVAVNNELLEALRDRIDTVETRKPEGHLYELEMDEATAANMLDWDAPMSEQPEAVRNLVSENFADDPDAMNMTGAEFYKRLQDDPDLGLTEADLEANLYPLMEKYGISGDISPHQTLPEWASQVIADNRAKFSLEEKALLDDMMLTRPDAQVSAYLRGEGIPGVRYFDGDSRAGNVSDRTRNYVTFSDDIVRPVSVNGEPLVVEEALGAKPTGTITPDLNPNSVQSKLERGMYHPIAGASAATPGKVLSAPLHELTRAIAHRPGFQLPGEFNLADHMGATIKALPGDLSRAGVDVHRIGDTELTRPIPSHGGAFYSQEVPGQGWASGDTVIQEINKDVVRIGEETGEPVLGAFSPMSHMSANFNTMTTEGAWDLIKQAEIPKEFKTDFDGELRNVTIRKKGRPDQKPGEGWLGLDHPEALDQLKKNPPMRRAFNDILSQSKWRNKGFPEMAQVRGAFAEPGLINTPIGQGGQNVIKLTGKTVDEPALIHPTYPSVAGGTSVGGIPEGLPRSIVYRDWYNKRRAEGKSENTDHRSFELAKPTQRIDQQMVDEAEKWLKLQRAIARGL